MVDGVIKFYMCIDDTDNLESIGTGALAENLIKRLKEEGIGDYGYITRHQLFLHDDIKYTSHNSSMCFDGSCLEVDKGRLIELAQVYLSKHHATGSDPGLCVLFYTESSHLQEVYKTLITYGEDAKKKVLTKSLAYDLSESLGIHLSEHGGTGSGIIGALAGVGLRIGGNDGEIKGGTKRYFKKESITVSEALDSPYIDGVREVSGLPLDMDDIIHFSKHNKTILDKHQLIMLVNKDHKGLISTCSKEQLRSYRESCDLFEADVFEEQISEHKSCHNCRYRRWTNKSFKCMKKHYDVVIIGGGIVGSFVARSLSQYRMRVLLLEKNADIGCGVTKANSAILHTGYSVHEGSLKAKLNVASSKIYEQVCEELDVPYRKTGSLLVCSGAKGEKELRKKYQRGLNNGVEGLKIVEKEALHQMEANLNKDVYLGMYAENTAVSNPWQLAIKAAENAVQNGVELRTNTTVDAIEKIEDKEGNDLFNLKISHGEITCTHLINCAGLNGALINNMIGKPYFGIGLRKGEWMVYDKKFGNHVNHILFYAKESSELKDKGVIVAQTIHGNLMVGPTARDVEEAGDLSVSQEGIEELQMKALRTLTHLPEQGVIKAFAGMRTKPEMWLYDEDGNRYVEDDKKDFIIGHSPDVKNMINVAGIKSPGVASAPAIGAYVRDLLFENQTFDKDSDYNPRNPKRVVMHTLNIEDKQRMIKKNPKYGNILCKCQLISEGEVIDAINSTIGARSIDGIKRRVNAMMGPCQGGFCTSRMIEILARELNVDMDKVYKEDTDAYILTEKI